MLEPTEFMAGHNEVSIEVSIIIPIGPGDEAWRQLLPDLAEVPFAAEIICVATHEPEDLNEMKQAVLPHSLNWIVTEPGRAKQLNLGARAAHGRFLWFLHSDSRVTTAALHALAKSLERAPNALHYFNLTFADGYPLMTINSCGVWWRSHLFGMPFGDQGFCLERMLFDRLGGYPESTPYGEDQLLVWIARRRGVALQCTGGTLPTSARKYRINGWSRTTLRHLTATYRQAWPQFWLWLWGH